MRIRLMLVFIGDIAYSFFGIFIGLRPNGCFVNRTNGDGTASGFARYDQNLDHAGMLSSPSGERRL